MPESIVLYHAFNNYEWGTRYYISPPGLEPIADIAEDLAQAESPLFSDNIAITRFEHLDNDGSIIQGGPLAIQDANTNDMMPLNYAILIRLVSGGPKRPSTKYIHGWCENFQTDGEANTALSTAITNYSTAIVARGVQDSDDFTVVAAQFRKFTRRRRIRRLL